MTTVPFCVCPNHGRELLWGLMNKAHIADLLSEERGPSQPRHPWMMNKTHPMSLQVSRYNRWHKYSITNLNTQLMFKNRVKCFMWIISLNLTITLGGRDIYYSHFTNEDIETLEKKKKNLACATLPVNNKEKDQPCKYYYILPMNK